MRHKPDVMSDPSASRTPSPWRKPTVADNVLLMLLAIGLVLVPQGILSFADARCEPYEHLGWMYHFLLSLPLAAVLCLVAGGLTWLAFGRSPARGLAIFAILCAMPVLAYRAIGYVNVAYDHSPGVTVTVECVRHIRRHKGRDTDEVTSWRKPGETLELELLALDDARCGARAPVTLIVHPGRLGVEWVTVTAGPGCSR
jgi:hypothetical protein